jgi:hypothetical protein
MEKASGGRFAWVTRKTDEDEGRRLGQGRLGHRAKHVPRLHVLAWICAARRDPITWPARGYLRLGAPPWPFGPAPKGLQDSAQGFNPGNPQNKRLALKGREMRLPDESRTYCRAKVRVRH